MKPTQNVQQCYPQQTSSTQPSNVIQSTFNSARARSFSQATPMLEGMRYITSPGPFTQLTQLNLFDPNYSMGADFRLEEDHQPEEKVMPVHESSEEEAPDTDFPDFPSDEEVNKENMVQFLVDSINLNEKRIHAHREELQRSDQGFQLEVFTYLYKRFKKTKKTKEEMIKYTMRKSFKYITDEMKDDDPELNSNINSDGIEGMSIYFNRCCEDQQISIPFKKNSLEKTMNVTFLKKVFSINQFVKDYKRFLRTFQDEFLKDNHKKVVSMNEAVKLCFQTKNFKSLDNYKRIPWTKDILMRLKNFAKDLLIYSPQVTSIEPQPRQSQSFSMMDNRDSQPLRKFTEPSHTLFNDQDDKEESNMIGEVQARPPKRKNVIILSPGMMPMNSPKINMDEEPLI